MKNTVVICLFALLAGRGSPAAAEDPEPPVGPPVPAASDPGEGEAGEAPSAAPGEHDVAIDGALAALRGEPTLAELQRAALRLADADPERTRDWMRRPNSSQVLPRFKVTVDYDLERDESLDRDQVGPDEWGADTDRDLELQLSAQWELSRLVFNPDEVRVYGALANRAQRRENVLTTLVGYYYERRKLQLTWIVDPPSEMADVVELRLRIDELTAMIDALTGGLLSRTLGEDSTQRTKPR